MCICTYMCVYMCFSHIEKTEWDKAQRTLENLTTWQPLADYSWDVTLITVEKWCGVCTVQ